MPFLPPNQRRQSTEDRKNILLQIIIIIIIIQNKIVTKYVQHLWYTVEQAAIMH